MFSVNQKREIADEIQKILRATNHPELPKGEIQFKIHIDGAEAWSWADIQNNGAVVAPGVNPWNEAQDTHKPNDDYPQLIDFDGPSDGKPKPLSFGL